MSILCRTGGCGAVRVDIPTESRGMFASETVVGGVNEVKWARRDDARARWGCESYLWDRKLIPSSAMFPPPQVEDEKLFLPSDLTTVERGDLGLTRQAFDALRATRTVVKAIRALQDRKEKYERQQKQNSRAGDHIKEVQRRRDFRMATYETARVAMISLDSFSHGPESAFPPLSVADTFMKSVMKKRQLGDSHLTDGRLFTIGAGTIGLPSTHPVDPSSVPAAEDSSSEARASTQMSKRKSGAARGKKVPSLIVEPPDTSGQRLFLLGLVPHGRPCAHPVSKIVYGLWSGGAYSFLLTLVCNRVSSLAPPRVYFRLAIQNDGHPAADWDGVRMRSVGGDRERKRERERR
ncbi:hypothetical protein B0H14DRAFT_2637020 [Mycena olivaceomarginata]|nr:hypothetical protein B0H14DRAFT_2637020 [Mycena olivaceomarginata]